MSKSKNKRAVKGTWKMDWPTAIVCCVGIVSATALWISDQINTRIENVDASQKRPMIHRLFGVTKDDDKDEYEAHL